MFSQFRSVVEGLSQAQVARRNSQDTTNERQASAVDHNTVHAAIFDSPTSDPLSNLRRSVASGRAATPPPASSSSSVPDTPERSGKRRLEDRLRASFAIGDASDTSTPAASSRVSPSLSSNMEIAHHPESVPLPPSPPLSAQDAKPDVPPLPTSSPATSSPLGTTAHSSMIATNDSSPSHTEDQRTSVDPLEIPLPLLTNETLLSSGSPLLMKGQRAEVARIVQFGKAISEDGAAAQSPSDGNGQDGSPTDTPFGERGQKSNLTEDSSSSDDASLLGSELLIARGHSEQLTLPTNEAFILREHLRISERNFEDVSSSLKELQTETRAADEVLHELTAVPSLRNTNELRDFLKNILIRYEMSQDEIKRLNGKLTRQDERVEELREIHRLESQSQVDLIDRLRKQVQEAESLVQASNNLTPNLEQEIDKYKLDLHKSDLEVQRLKSAVKDEEEKRTKAVSLLKTVRQKLVKAEKEREDAIKEMSLQIEKEKQEQERERVERATLQAQLVQLKTERDATVLNLENRYERDLTVFQDKSEKEFTTLKAKFELDALANKLAHEQALNIEHERYMMLENTIQTLSGEKNSLFDQLQLRQAEVESLQSHLEVMQSENTELRFQLREHSDKVYVLQEELAEAARELSTESRGPSNSAEETARLLAAAETRHESKLAEIRRNLVAMEVERAELEAEWSRKLDEKSKEVEKWKYIVDSSTKDLQENDDVVERMKEQLASTVQDLVQCREQIVRLEYQVEQHASVEHDSRALVIELNARVNALEQQAEEARTREGQARAHNKTLREELRKVQSSAALLERQRVPGVGYWSNRQDGNSTRSSAASPAPNTPRDGSPTPTRGSSSNEEELNLEYLRNVIFQFLEHKEMRPNLVRVLSTILRFTPQETRRLLAKV